MSKSVEKDESVPKRIYFFRQVLICSGIWSWLFINGLNTGTPTVLIPQLRKEANSTEAVTNEEASWLGAILMYSAVPWAVVLAITGAFAGRKACQLLVSICALIGFVIFYCSSNVHSIMISQCFEGVSIASAIILAIFVLTEYTSPEYRGLLLSIKTGTFFFGILVSNTIGTFYHWKNIAYVGFVAAIYSLVTLFFWPESPLWLAKQGRFDECIKSHKWLQGVNERAKKDLNDYITNNQTCTQKVSLKHQIINIKSIVAEKKFYKPVFLCIVTYLLYLTSGKLVYSVYAIEILNKLAKDRSSAYRDMLILDGVTVFSLYVGSVLAKFIKRRKLLLLSSTISIMFLYVLSLYLYLVKLHIISEDIYVSLSLLVGFSISISFGPLTLTPTLCGELSPIDSRSFAVCLTGLAMSIMTGTTFKISPYIFKSCGIHGGFLVFGLSSTVCLLVLYFYLPETKDKTLQEIADCIIGRTSTVSAKEIISNTQNDTTEKMLKIHKS